MGVAPALRQATERLALISATPRLDAELLLAHALEIDRNELLMRQRDLSVPPGFETLLQRRLTGEPIAYITGARDFWTISLRVTPDVLIPRPDSETLIEAALDHFGVRSPARILDLGTGSGALLLAALSQWPQASGVGVDISPAALAVARGNADRLDLSERADFRMGDWAEGMDGSFDLILINPPYIARDVALAGDVLHEPESALFAGADGLDDYRRIAPMLPRLLAPDGMAAIEIGYDQRLSVSTLLADQGLSVAVRHDLAGHDRCLIATLAPSV
ncbi:MULTISPECIES: peptide chain release factor N(5)-glutamine methyltransferase [Sphingobium]|uniref:Release factor glutamine methyltransferase n=1 Tax=Sphingobium fuliginis (strain ATCC 27551) TaxID=336203 RepID=A0ABQ1FAM0_SPHSA|nr:MULTISPECIES: peptide chain release factor N(5)-glutamine methyltransferase [Sphingobium]AJR23189.1 SAM-dependent methyltransferase [Sphingobium sp. YBL2]RYL96119.1 peptide chain release factor N(5)-glutamine methyltransferase [Sphingobium fuliginis]WDA34679.1 peptide chain release factor N(5)-glutamine methyltransferase [Sphingobium sp. YC-XJ3]GGA04308.1 release factor glutamine methyltransferase [Sphingobium fuliginis]